MAGIVFDCERMKYPHTGLYHYCLQLGRALAATPHQETLYFYAPPAANALFGTDQHYITQHVMHKWKLPNITTPVVWHATHQGTEYFPAGKNYPVVLTIHDLNFLHDENKPRWRKQRYLASLRKKLHRADAITCISNYTRSEVLRHFDLHSKPVTVIYNGCNIDPYAAEEAPPHAPSGAFLFTIGAITPKKNFHVLPRLLAGNDFTLVIAGAGAESAYGQAIRDEAARLGVSGRLQFTGAIPETQKQWYLKNCTAFAFPSLAEGFGLPVIEAMSFGKPVFLSDRTSLPEIGGDLAYYFPPLIPRLCRKCWRKDWRIMQPPNRPP